MVMRTRISGSITRIVLGDVSLGLWSSAAMSGERQQRERVLGAFNSERRVSGSAEGRTDVRSRPRMATRLGKHAFCDHCREGMNGYRGSSATHKTLKRQRRC